MLAGPSFGLTLIAFYYSSSKLTKFKAHIKQQLEKDFKDGGQRSPAQARLAPQLVPLLDQVDWAIMCQKPSPVVQTNI